ncbi:fucose permease [Murinocardiopsis flavida]|uniref:Fucose permease n=1 Tax=Murinocardiopsis flavida TaxID=645275 RepID=A0A2P8DLS6_9ACTN|nr:MFS transporter [Murinocardiopsis flavida]PSK98169.1 fucose permease [Murinocardiopsis flavida]
MSANPQTAATTDPVARRARAAVAALFLANGFTVTNIVPWWPVLKDTLHLSNTAVGTAIAAMPFGALALGMLAGPLIARFGSARVSVVTGLLAALTLPLVSLAPGWWALAMAMFVLGTMDTWMDSAMNAHGLRVQRRYGRTIINTFHAVWSIGAVAGGLTGTAMSALGVPMAAHLAGVTVLLIAVTLGSYRFLLTGPEHAERSEESHTPTAREVRRLIGKAAGTLVALSALLMMAGAIEDSAAAWGAVYMRDQFAAPAVLVGLPFVVCQAMMTIGRLFGDRLTDRFGAVTVTRAGMVIAAVGLGFALLVPHPLTTIAGFGLSGLGVAVLFPLALAAAGEIPGVRSGDGVAITAWLGRVGFLAFPPLIGLIADASSLRMGLWAIPVAAVLAFVLARPLRRAAREHA